jgi:hypothetical protein
VLSLTLDSGLNLLWLGISVAALLWFGRLERKRSGRVRRQRLFAVFLATIALFPIVSDSDDLFNFSLLRMPGAHQRAGTTAPEDEREKNNLHLARVLESLDHFQLAAFFQVTMALCFVAVLSTRRLVCCSRPVLAAGGRAPPLV